LLKERDDNYYSAKISGCAANRKRSVCFILLLPEIENLLSEIKDSLLLPEIKDTPT